MNQNAEVFGAILEAIFTPPSRWMIAIIVAGQLIVIGLAIYGALHLAGAA